MFGLAISITHISVFITHNSKIVGAIAKRLFGKSITLFPSLNYLIFELWVMETENTFWLFLVSITHNSMAILQLNTYRGFTNSTQPQLLTTFWLFFFFLLLGWLFGSFFFFFFFFFFFNLLLLLSLVQSVLDFFFFFLLLSLVRSVLGFFFFFFFFSLGSVSLGTEGKKKKKLHWETGMGPTNSVKNIKWWEVSDGAKQTWYFRVMSDEW